MRVTCEFCDNEVEISGNMTCPHCGGVLADAARRERERLQKIADEERRRQLELEKERLKTEQKRLKAEAADSDNEKWGRILAGVMGGSLLGLSPFARIRNFLSRIFRDLSGFIKVLCVIAAAAVIYFICKSFFA